MAMTVVLPDHQKSVRWWVCITTAGRTGAAGIRTGTALGTAVRVGIDSALRLGGAVELGPGVGRDIETVLPAEGVVDLEKYVLLPLVDRRIGQYDRPCLQLLPLPLVEDPGPHVERLGGDPQGLRDLLEHLGTRLAQTALDLAEIRIGHPGGVGELPQGELRGTPLLTQVLAEIADVE